MEERSALNSHQDLGVINKCSWSHGSELEKVERHGCSEGEKSAKVIKKASQKGGRRTTIGCSLRNQTEGSDAICEISCKKGFSNFSLMTFARISFSNM